MRALQFDGTDLSVVDRPDPAALPGQAVVAVGGAGLCHSDLTVMSRPVDLHPFPLPMVLGHELAGTVVEVGPGVTTLAVGDQVAGYGPRGCGGCRACAQGEDNYCRHRAGGAFPPGLGADGALAEFVTVDARYLVSSEGVDVLQAAALTDAGLTAWHSVRRAMEGCPPIGEVTVVVLGIGGLGHLAVQILRHLGVTRIVAVDVSEEKLALARRSGATRTLLAGPELSDEVRELTRGLGADVVLDFVASEATLAASATMAAIGGWISIVGVGSGTLPVAMHAVPLGTRIDLPFWGTRSDLHDVLELARVGALDVQVSSFGLDEAAQAYDLLDRGAVLGRAVVRPDVSTESGRTA